MFTYISRKISKTKDRAHVLGVLKGIMLITAEGYQDCRMNCTKWQGKEQQAQACQSSSIPKSGLNNEMSMKRSCPFLVFFRSIPQCSLRRPAFPPILSWARLLSLSPRIGRRVFHRSTIPRPLRLISWLKVWCR